MNNSLRRIAENRIKNPLTRCFGTLSETSIETLLYHFSYIEPTIRSAMHLRNGTGIDLDENEYYKYIKSSNGNTIYDQYDIQYPKNINIPSEKDYIHVDENFLGIKKELSEMLSSEIYRMRYASIETDNELGWHVDQQTFDRFIVLLQGSHEMQFKVKKDIQTQPMAIGEVWFINSAYEHRVINTDNKRRLALLGCFEYNVK